MDVVVLKDDRIAREKHASIVYDPKGHGFYISPEDANLGVSERYIAVKCAKIEQKMTKYESERANLYLYHIVRRREDGWKNKEIHRSAWITAAGGIMAAAGNSGAGKDIYDTLSCRAGTRKSTGCYGLCDQGGK